MFRCTPSAPGRNHSGSSGATSYPSWVRAMILTICSGWSDLHKGTRPLCSVLRAQTSRTFASSNLAGPNPAQAKVPPDLNCIAAPWSAKCMTLGEKTKSTLPGLKVVGLPKGRGAVAEAAGAQTLLCESYVLGHHVSDDNVEPVAQLPGVRAVPIVHVVRGVELAIVGLVVFEDARKEGDVGAGATFEEVVPKGLVASEGFGVGVHGYNCSSLDVDFAFHSAQTDPILDEFEDIARTGVFSTRSTYPSFRLYSARSSSTERRSTAIACDAPRGSQ